MTDRHAPTVTSAVFRLQRSSVDLNRIMTVSRFIPYAFFFVTSAPPPVAMSLLAQATQTATEQWNWSANEARFTVRSSGRGIYDYFTPIFRGDMIASVAGANVRVTMKKAVATRILDMALLCLFL